MQDQKIDFEEAFKCLSEVLGMYRFKFLLINQFCQEKFGLGTNLYALISSIF